MQKRNEIELTQFDWDQLIGGFNYEVKQNAYNPLPYEEFQKLKHTNIPTLYPAKLQRYLNHISFTHRSNNDFVTFDTYETNDGSFGEYLFDTFFKRKDNDMPPKDSTNEYPKYYDWNTLNSHCGSDSTAVTAVDYADTASTIGVPLEYLDSTSVTPAPWASHYDSTVRVNGNEVLTQKDLNEIQKELEKIREEFPDYQTIDYKLNPLYNEIENLKMKNDQLLDKIHRLEIEKADLCDTVSRDDEVRSEVCGMMAKYVDRYISDAIEAELYDSGIPSRLNKVEEQIIIRDGEVLVWDGNDYIKLQEKVNSMEVVYDGDPIVYTDYWSGSSDSKNRKENGKMNTNKMFNFEFGPVDGNIRMSPYGMAIRNADGKYVSYDTKTGSVMDVDILNFEGNKFMYKMPVAVKDIAVGDVVIHNRKPMFVTNVGNQVSVVDIYNGEVKTILPTKNAFGFDFIVKVVSLIDFSGANAENPFGSMWPFLVMGEGTNMKDIMMMMALANGNIGAMANNPMLMTMMLSNDNSMKEMLPLVMMGQLVAPAAVPAKQHNCGCHNHTKEENHG